MSPRKHYSLIAAAVLAGTIISTVVLESEFGSSNRCFEVLFCALCNIAGGFLYVYLSTQCACLNFADYD